MTYKKQDIVLVPFPFNDQPGFKKRPAVIISNENHYKEYGKYICLAITSQEKRSDTVRYELKMYKTTSIGLLYSDQWVLPNKVFSIENRIILKKLGTMDEKDFRKAEAMFNDILR
ncbi:type II toxin-antitoxin system PemK/MazF family toxin [Oceanobacillus halotolerans]|uniref:type II toxin-antitoxin system PemK/MazF family toxin n=1 Tax=Oceanobacillus halotolerans TaxID=2663380 RepID=UPI0013DCB4D1|nr:type II toxin-antitoxin system PemK/MazF family toxin [Oceanobacillus halotolerans]